jgi:hypothetical protein
MMMSVLQPTIVGMFFPSSSRRVAANRLNEPIHFVTNLTGPALEGGTGRFV